MIHLGTGTLETNRLLLRKFQLSDAAAMFGNWANDPEVTKYLTWPPHGNSGISEAIITEWVSQYDNKDFYQWAIILKSNGDEPVGGISVVRQDERIGMVHIGYCIGAKWWNQGIVSEAMSELVRFFFEDVGANRVEARYDPRNVGSGKVMEKCGLIYEGTVKQGDWNNQGICDCAMYGLVLADYKN